MSTCFVVMGFGIKTDYQSGRKLDLDKSYLNLIKPAAEEAGLQCIRADEIVHAGIIDVPMYEQLLTADVVVADVSTMNPNAFYELGVRHALRPYTTIIVAESELKFPFDVGHTVIRQYRHLGEDIGVSEARRFKNELSSAIRQIMAEPKKDDSPVYTFLRLNPPIRIQEQVAAMQEGYAAPVADGSKNETLRTLLNEAEAARASGKWAVAKMMLERVREEMEKKTQRGVTPVDSYILQQLALATYKADGSEAGLKEASVVLQELHPETSNDPETLGIWGAINKRLWEKTADRGALDRAINSYERGFYLRDDYYNAINFAFLLNVRAAASSGDDRIADRVAANRIRRQVIPVCRKLLQEPELSPSDRYWAIATMAEACYGLAEIAEFNSLMAQATQIAPEPWMVTSTKEQIAKLADLLGETARTTPRTDGA
jgi:MAP3K TRAFs-binding domain